MRIPLLRIYDKLVLERPLLTILVVLAVVGFFAAQVPKFKLDASGDSLVLENDADLRYHRATVDRYGASDVLVLTYTPRGDVFAAESLAEIKALRDELRQLPGVQSVLTILDVPLLLTSGLSLGDLADADTVRKLESSGADIPAARAEMQENPLYRGRLLSKDGKTTTLLLTLPADETYRSLLKRRYELRERKYDNLLTGAEELELADVSRRYRQQLAVVTERESRLVAAVRAIRDRHQGSAQIFLGGVPMIVADMISFIKGDLVVFGGGVLLFLIVTLTIIFRRLRWVLLSLFCCAAAVVTMLGYLGLVDWRVTVISSNFISLMIILTMSLTIHLIVRYLEVQAASPEADQRTLVLEAVRTIVKPCLYTTLTTVVAFTSLLVSDIRPVMDFGKMMTIGLMVSFLIAFLLFPATVLLLGKKGGPAESADASDPFTMIFARFTERHGTKILLFCLALMVVSGIGIGRLKVENRFIDYFRESTEIFQGMSLIDRQLGGTTPLDLIVDFKQKPANGADAVDDELQDLLDDDLSLGQETAEEPVSWAADVYTMEQVERIHDFLDGLPETGEVLSVATALKIATRLNDGVPLENYELSLLHKKCPPEINDLLIRPYVAGDIPQARFAMRVVESEKRMERLALLGKIRTFLVDEMGFDAAQIHFTNMFVLYNNMLQSLFRSQILTIGMVFLGILAMFVVLFRSFYLALIATIPNIAPVAVVLGTLGWLGIPLDMMTITIASISIGIAVDDTIHYVHRFQREFRRDRNYRATMRRCHGSIGRAMYYTSITITSGFSILVLSNFLPTIYFGLFTGFAMVVALLADLLLLPQLLIVLRPLGPEGGDA
ncbi:MAG: MMPL family transporter [Desulfobulbaceae bacterium]|nr:MMPL family transporter [Desulfobulbaceae bacterium]